MPSSGMLRRNIPEDGILLNTKADQEHATVREQLRRQRSAVAKFITAVKAKQQFARSDSELSSGEQRPCEKYCTL
jgi:hypothetical protein